MYDNANSFSQIQKINKDKYSKQFSFGKKEKVLAHKVLILEGLFFNCLKTDQFPFKYD